MISQAPRDDPYKDDVPWAHVDAEGMSGRVFFIAQNAEYLNTGRELLTVEQIKKAIRKRE